jgi:hypothetical protein
MYGNMWLGFFHPLVIFMEKLKWGALLNQLLVELETLL